MNEQQYALFDVYALRIPQYRLFRFDQHESRFYYTFDLTGNLSMFAGCTHILDVVFGMPESIIYYYVHRGIEEGKAYRDERAAFGTLLHKEFTAAAILKQIQLDLVTEKVKAEFEENRYTYNFGAWVAELEKALLAFAQWWQDYQVIPLIAEGMLCSQEFQFASAVDLFCRLQFNGKQRLALVDYKSNTSGNFYEKHEYQLYMQDVLIRENFPEYAGDEILLFNMSPKDWRLQESAKPTYHFKNQTCDDSREYVEAIMTLYNAKKNTNPATKPVLSTYGTLSLHHEHPDDITAHFDVKSCADLVQEGEDSHERSTVTKE